MVKKWTNDYLKLEALKYKTRSEFNEKAKSAYYCAYRRKILEVICEHMSPLIRYDFNTVKLEALKYKTKFDVERREIAQKIKDVFENIKSFYPTYTEKEFHQDINMSINDIDETIGYFETIINDSPPSIRKLSIAGLSRYKAIREYLLSDLYKREKFIENMFTILDKGNEQSFNLKKEYLGINEGVKPLIQKLLREALELNKR